MTWRIGCKKESLPGRVACEGLGHSRNGGLILNASDNGNSASMVCKRKAIMSECSSRNRITSLHGDNLMRHRTLALLRKPH